MIGTTCARELYRRKKAVPCAHCRTGVVTRPRGLCWPCYYTPGVKEGYGSTHRGASRGVGNGLYSVPLAPEPTAHPPGSPEKVAVMEERAAAGYAVFHPHDARWGLT